MDSVRQERNKQTQTHPFIVQIDHIGIHMQDPARLFAFCTDVLDLPVAFPFAEYPSYTTGSVVLGNCFLEITRFGAPTPNAPPPHFHILGLLLHPERLSYTVQELKRQGIANSGAVPFFAPEATDENPRKLWTNIFLGGFLDDGFWRRVFFAMTNAATPKPSMQRSKFGMAMSEFLLTRSFPNGFPVLTEYHAQNDDHKRAADREALRQRHGGALGIEDVAEVLVGVTETEPTETKWARLLAPVAPESPGVWHLGAGPALRLVPQSHRKIQTIALKVQSLARARQFITEAGLAAEDLSAQSGGERVELTLPGTQGLTVQLTE